MRRWLSSILHWLWLTVETAWRRQPDVPYRQDPFRGQLGLVMVDGEIVTHVSEDDLDTLAALVDPSNPAVTTDDAGEAELHTLITGLRMAQRLDVLGVNEVVAEQTFAELVRHHVEFLNNRIMEPDLTIDLAILVDERIFYESFTVQEWLTRIRGAALTAGPLRCMTAGL